MDLSLILEKTRKKSDGIKRTREPVHIATLDRPYETTKDGIFKTDNKVATNHQQSGNKPPTKWQQTDNTKTDNNKETNNKLITKLTTQPITKWQQTANKVTTNSPFSTLTGLQRKITIFVFNECKKSLSKITEPLTLEYISHYIDSTKRSIKTSIYRLEIKGVLLRIEYKNGRGGWTKYELPKDIFHDLLQSETNNKLATNWQQTNNKLASEVTTQLTTTPSSSSSYDYIKTTTTGDVLVNVENVVSQELTPEWQTLNIDPLSQIGFTMTHLAQLAKSNKLPPAIVQDSIDAFAFDLAHNEKAKTIKGSPINLFMGILRNGQPYAAPSNFESPVAHSMRLYCERKKAEEQKIEMMTKELWELDFNAWHNALSVEEKDSLLPEETRRQKITGPKIAYLRTYHREKLWPNKREDIFKHVHQEKNTV